MKLLNKTTIVSILILSNLTFAYTQQKEIGVKEYCSQYVDSQKGSWGVGLSFRNYRIVDELPTPAYKVYFPVFSLRLYYNALKNTTLGLDYSQQLLWGSGIEGVKRLFYTGPYIRYDFFKRRTTFYGQLGYKISDAAWQDANVYKIFPTHYSTFGLGLKAKLYPNTYFNYSQNLYVNLAHPEKASRLIDKQVGLEFYFNRKQKDVPIYVPDNKKDRSGKFVFGISAAFMPFDTYDFEGGYNLTECTQRLGFYQSNFMNFGLFTGLAVGNSGLPNTPAQNFYYVGPYVNFKLFALRKFNYIMEFSYLSSNFTSIDGLLPIPPVKGYSEYFVTSTGFAYRINNNLSMELLVNRGTCIRSPYDCKGGGIGGYRLGIERTFELKRKKTIRSNG
jgi:hypothetical protein